MTQPIGRREAIKYALLAALFGTTGGMIVQGSSAPSGDFIQKSPSIIQKAIGQVPNSNHVFELQDRSDASSDSGLVKMRFAADADPTIANKVGARIDSDGFLAFTYSVIKVWDDSGPIASAAVMGAVDSVDFAGSTAMQLGSGLDDDVNVDSLDFGRVGQKGESRNVRLSTQTYDAYNSLYSQSVPTGRSLFIDTSVSDRLTWREETTPTNKRSALHTADTVKHFAGPIAFRPIVTATSINLTMTTSHYAVMATGGASGITVTLPAASNTGMVAFIKKVDSGAGAVTVSRAGSDTIEGATSISLASQWNAVHLMARASNSWVKLPGSL